MKKNLKKHFYRLTLLLLFLTSVTHALAFEFITHNVDSNLDGACSVYGVDLNGDNLTDVVAGGWNNGSVTKWYENNGDYTFTAHDLPNTIPIRQLICADLDSDSDYDIIVSSSTGNHVSWWENDGEGNFTFEQIAVLQAAHTSDVYDMDGDGDMDIINGGMIAGVTLLINDGEENFTANPLGGADQAVSDVHAVDLDQDGDMDIVSVEYTGSQITWYEHIISGIYEAHQIPITINGAHWSSVDDLDGDGDLDIAVAAYNASRVYMLENDGDQGFTISTLMTLTGASWIGTEDIDQDGDIDILASGEVANQIYWLENSGLGAFEEHLIIQNYTRVMGQHILDFDDDGDIDFLSAAVVADDVVLFENNSNYPEAVNSWVTPLIVEPGTGVVTITAEVEDHGAENVAVTAVISSYDDTIEETVELFDDGAHGDGDANDGIWGNTYSAPDWQDFYGIRLLVMDLDNQTHTIFENYLYFTTAGPLEFEYLAISLSSDTIPEPGEGTSFITYFSNAGTAGSITDMEVEITIEDELVSFLNGSNVNSRYLVDIAAGETGGHLSPVNIEISEDFPANSDINFTLALKFMGTEFWSYPATMHVYGGNWTGENLIPEEFTIHNAYPNPFNSTVRLGFNMPCAANISVDVYNLLGEKVDNVTSGFYSAGSNSISYTPSNLASGTYIVKYNSDRFEQKLQKIQFIK